MQKMQGKVSNDCGAVLTVITCALRYQNWVLGICEYPLSCNCHEKQKNHSPNHELCILMNIILSEETEDHLLVKQYHYLTFFLEKVGVLSASNIVRLSQRLHIKTPAATRKWNRQIKLFDATPQILIVLCAIADTF